MIAGALRVASGLRRAVPLRAAVLVLVVVPLIGAAAATGAGPARVPFAGSSPCQFQKAAHPVRVAFCDSFDHGFAQTNGSREGTDSGLDPRVWGASRIIAGGGSHFATGTNPSQGTDDSFAPVSTAAGDCGGSQSVVPDRDIQVCGGTLFDSVNDDGGQTVLAMYPKQPFNISGRTGTVTFDVSDNTQGIHSAWPSFVYTDQPVPAPYSEASGIQPSARNSFGVSFAQRCDRASNQYCTAAPGSQARCPNTNDVTVDSMFETRDYSLSAVPFTITGCVARASQAGRENHVEITISTSTVKVFMSNPGSSSLIEVAVADSAGVPLTNGLVWIEDNHYNADKFDTQQSNTFAWSDLGFDGPIEARDIGYDVPNNGSLKGAAERLGWNTGVGDVSTVTVTAPGVSSRALRRARGALVVFNWFPLTRSVPGISVNGKPFVGTPWPFTASTTGRYGGKNDDTYVWRTMAVPVPLAEIRAGDDSIRFQNAPYGLANVSLILEGAGGVPTCLDPSSCAGETGPGPS